MNLSSLVICTPTNGGQYVLSLDGQTVTDSSLKDGIAKLLTGQGITVDSLKSLPPTYNRDLLLGILGEKVENPPAGVLPDGSYYDSGMGAGAETAPEADKSHGREPEKPAPPSPANETPVLAQNGAVTIAVTGREEALTLLIKRLAAEHKSSRQIAELLQSEGIEISHMTVARRLQGQEVLMFQKEAKGVPNK